MGTGTDHRQAGIAASFNDAVSDINPAPAPSSANTSLQQTFTRAADDPPKRIVIRDVLLGKKEVEQIITDKAGGNISRKKLGNKYTKQQKEIRAPFKYETRLLEAFKDGNAEEFHTVMDELEALYPNATFVFDAAEYKGSERKPHIERQDEITGFDFARPNWQFLGLMSARVIYRDCVFDTADFFVSKTLSEGALERQPAIMKSTMFVDCFFTHEPMDQADDQAKPLFTDVRSVKSRARDSYAESKLSLNDKDGTQKADIIPVADLKKEHNYVRVPGSTEEYKPYPFFDPNGTCIMIDCAIDPSLDDETVQKVFGNVHIESSGTDGKVDKRRQQQLIAENDPIGRERTGKVPGTERFKAKTKNRRFRREKRRFFISCYGEQNAAALRK